MVVLHYKKTDLNQFLFETYTAIKVQDLLNELCEGKQSNLIKKLDNLWKIVEIIDLSYFKTDQIF